MFIEELWAEKPELVEKAVKKIFNVREECGDSLKFVTMANGALQFNKYGHHSYTIIVTDFEVYGFIPNSKYSIDWMKFMYKVYGDKYALQFISQRNKKLDKYMAEYEEKYNDETRLVLDKMGFQLSKGKTK